MCQIGVVSTTLLTCWCEGMTQTETIQLASSLSQNRCFPKLVCFGNPKVHSPGHSTTIEPTSKKSALTMGGPSSRLYSGISRTAGSTSSRIAWKQGEKPAGKRQPIKKMVASQNGPLHMIVLQNECASSWLVAKGSERKEPRLID